MKWPRMINISFDTTKSMSKEEFRQRYPSYLRSPWWKSIRQRVLEKINYRCALCSSREKVQGHHTPLGYEYLHRESDIPGKHIIPLCRHCHEKYHFELDPFSLEEAKGNFRTSLSFVPWQENLG